MVDNFNTINKLLKFDNDNEDVFYFAQILKRKKEHPELGSNSYVVKTYYIKSLDDLEFYKGEMICLANFHDARVCINLNRRSFERMAFHTMRKVADQIMNKDFKSVRAAYNSVCGEYSQESDKLWILDIDTIGRKVNDILLYIERECQPIGNKYISTIPTKNGFHLITKPFNLSEFKQKYPDIEVHKNNPTILYIP